MEEASTSLPFSPTLFYQILTHARGTAALKPGASSLANIEINTFFFFFPNFGREIPFVMFFVLVWEQEEAPPGELCITHVSP